MGYYTDFEITISHINNKDAVLNTHKVKELLERYSERSWDDVVIGETFFHGPEISWDDYGDDFASISDDPELRDWLIEVETRGSEHDDIGHIAALNGKSIYEHAEIIYPPISLERLQGKINKEPEQVTLPKQLVKTALTWLSKAIEQKIHEPCVNPRSLVVARDHMQSIYDGKLQEPEPPSKQKLDEALDQITCLLGVIYQLGLPDDQYKLSVQTEWAEKFIESNPPAEHKLTMIWGEPACGVYNDESLEAAKANENVSHDIDELTFATGAELAAYTQGASACLGWSTYDFVDHSEGGDA